MQRPRLDRMLGDQRVIVEQLPPRRGMAAALRAARVLGPTLEALMLGTGIQLGPWRMTPLQVADLYKRDPRTGEWGNVTVSNMSTGQAVPETVSLGTHPIMAEAWLEVGRRVLNSLERVEPEEAVELAELLLVDVTWVGGEPGVPGTQRIVRAEQLDDVFPDAFSLIGAVRMGVELNLRPFVLVGSTALGTSVAPT